MPNLYVVRGYSAEVWALAPLVISATLLAACGQAGNASLSDQELRQRHHQCRMTSVLTTEQAVECKQIRRQCSERQADGEEVCAERF